MCLFRNAIQKCLQVYICRAKRDFTGHLIQFNYFIEKEGQDNQYKSKRGKLL